MATVQLVLDAPLQQGAEPGFGREIRTRDIAAFAHALDDVDDNGSVKLVWADPRTHTVMLRPRQLDPTWLDSTQQIPWIIRLAQLNVFASDITDGIIAEHAAFGNTASPWIYHTQTSASDYYPAAPTPFPGAGPDIMHGIVPGVDPGAVSIGTVEHTGGYALPATVPPPPPAAPPTPDHSVTTATGKFPFQTVETLGPNQGLFIRWLNALDSLGFPARYRFYVGQFCIAIQGNTIQILQDISPHGDRSLWKHVDKFSFLSHSPAGLDPDSIANNFQPLITPGDRTYPQQRWLMWLPFRRHQILLYTSSGRSKVIQVRPVPKRLPDDSDWDIVRADKLLVWFLVPHWGRVQIQKLAFSHLAPTINLPPIVLDFVPGGPPNTFLTADQDHGTSIAITQTTPASYVLPINNANDCPNIPAGIASIQARQFGHTMVLHSSPAVFNTDAAWTPFFYSLKITRDPVLIPATTTPTLVGGTTANPPAGADILISEFSNGLKPGEGQAEIEVADHPPYALQNLYYRGGNPVQIKRDGQVIFTGYTLAPGVEPLKQTNTLARRVKFTAADRWYQMTRTFLRDNRDWSGVSHLKAVKTVMQEAGVDTTGMDLPPDTPQNNQVLGIAGPADLTNMELDGRTNGPWQPRPSETAASFVERIAKHFSNYIVGFHGDGTPFYIPRYFYTASELTLYESKAAATAAGSPNAPLLRRHMFTTILPEAIIILVKAINVQTGAPRFSSLWVDWAAIKNKNVVNFLGWPKTEVVTIWGSYSCQGINWAARKIWDLTRRRFIRVKFECDYDPLIRVGHCLTLHNYGLYRVQSYATHLRKSTAALHLMSVDAEFVERGYGLPQMAPGQTTLTPTA